MKQLPWILAATMALGLAVTVVRHQQTEAQPQAFGGLQRMTDAEFVDMLVARYNNQVAVDDHYGMWNSLALLTNFYSEHGDTVNYKKWMAIGHGRPCECM